MANKLSGSGPVAPGPSTDGPSPGMMNALGAAPQASSMPPGGNMLSGPAMQPGMASGGPQGSAQPSPPSRETLIDVVDKQAYVCSTLKSLLSKPDLSDKYVISAVGEIVADGVMPPFDAAKYLRDLPAGGEPLQVRQWVAGHYANAEKTLGTVSEMIAAHGQMVRRNAVADAMAGPQMQMNALSGPPQGMPAPAMQGAPQ